MQRLRCMGWTEEMEMTRIRNLVGLVAVAALAVAAPALAHTRLVRSTPAANATIKGAQTITLTFNERVVPAFSKFALTMPQHGGVKVPVTTAVSRDGKQIVGTLRNPLGKGAYRVDWTAAGDDGHRITGHFAFTVG
jgi:methionine-rich copper-binding protein CopC